MCPSPAFSTVAEAAAWTDVTFSLISLAIRIQSKPPERSVLCASLSTTCGCVRDASNADDFDPGVVMTVFVEEKEVIDKVIAYL